MNERTRAFQWIVGIGMAFCIGGITGVGHAESELSLGLGGNFGGYYSTDFGDVDIDGGYYQKLEYDYFFSDYIGIGVYTSFGTSFSVPNENIYAVELGLALKPRITLEDLFGDVDFLGTIEVMVGYRGSFVDVGDDADGLGLNLGFDLRGRFDGGFEVFIEPGFVTQPAGSNGVSDITFGPIGYVLVGVGYSF